jgi:hypothetical protein
MGKYTTYSKKPPKPRDMGVHPVMRGIGCIMIVLVPILAYGIALLLFPYVNARWPFPPSWLEPVSVHPVLLGIKALEPVWNILLKQDNFIAILILTVAVIVVIGAIMSILYGYIYKIFGPPQYGPQDAPPMRVKVKRYKR